MNVSLAVSGPVFQDRVNFAGGQSTQEMQRNVEPAIANPVQHLQPPVNPDAVAWCRIQAVHSANAPILKRRSAQGVRIVHDRKITLYYNIVDD